MKINSLFWLLLILGAGTTKAADWKRYDIPGGYVEVDLGSVTKTDGDIRRALVRFTWNTPIKVGTGETIDYGTSTQEHDCIKREYRVSDAAFYYRGQRTPTSRSSNDWRQTGNSNAAHDAICQATLP